MLEYLCVTPVVQNIKCHGLVLWASILVIVSMVTYFNLTGFRFGQQSHQLSGPGQLSVSDVTNDLSKLMCIKYKISSSSKMDVFLVPAPAEVDAYNRTIITRQAADIFPGRFIPRNAFYLLEGSLIEMHACLGSRNVQKDVTVLLFKGDNSWNDWMAGRCEDCPFERDLIEQKCDNGTVLISFNVDHRDTYYVTVTTGNDHTITSLDVNVDAKVNATNFNTSKAIQSCHNNKECLLDLDYSVNEAAIVEFDEDDSVSFSTECSLRPASWASFFIGIPTIIMLISTAVYFQTCHKKTSKKDQRESMIINEDRKKLVSDYSSSREYQTMYMDPKGSV